MNVEHWSASVHHDGSPIYLSPAEPELGQVVRLRIRTGLEAPVERIFLRISRDGEQELAVLSLAGEDDACRWWEGELRITMARTSYRFYLHTAEGSWWLTAAGMLRHTPTDATDFRLLASYRGPRWVREAVFYQIFPERYADGDPSNNVASGEYLCHGSPVIARPWGARPRSHRESGGSEFFGGDLQGIVQHLDDLVELGVSALYLTPIFVSPSNHKYDVADYKRVDPHFGGDPALVALREALDRRGMRLLLDIVPNHCSASHPWFLEAQADLAASTAEFFTFERHPDQFATWLGVRSLPKLNYRSERLRELMYAGPDAVMRHWLRPPFRIDGWRVDVANMLGRQGEIQLDHKLGRAMRRAIKEEAPEAYLLGEHFYDASPYLQGDELDASMNYQGFTFPLLRWLAGFEMGQAWGKDWHDPHPLPTEALAAQWRAFMAAIPWQVALQQFNLLGSHDTPRILTIVGGDAALARLAATLLCTYPGTPSIYYGDEIGMEGGPDPDNRRCMPWEREGWSRELLGHYKGLIVLRRVAPALREGGFQLLYAQGHTLAYQRHAPGDQLIVVARRADDGLVALPVRHAGLPDGMRLSELQSGVMATVTQGLLPLEGLPAKGAQIWRVRT